MDLVNKKVIHETFGKGNVSNYNDSYIKIDFKSGNKRFNFPDAFKDYITFIDDKATELVNKQIEKKDERLRKEGIIREKEKALEKERQNLMDQRKREIESLKKPKRTGKIHSKIQSVFWCKPDEINEIFTDWKIFTGIFKSGKKEGQPRKLARMNENSACLLTKRDNSVPEEDRQILGVFLANESFDGRTNEDGYIRAHPRYRIRLTEQESEKLFFWNYYVDEKNETETIWKSGRQRYFDNIWMAQILRDIVILKKEHQERQDAQAFLDHFCRINSINQNELPEANGALKRV